jgi:Ca-activated chloride channel family protein
MKNLYTFLAILALPLLFTTPLHATFSLRVGDPRQSWSTQQGTIEEAVLSVRPKGLYYEYGLYLTFSARGTSYKAQDSLEVTLQFELPEAAIIHDSWLWIYDDIVRAKILDRWTAATIYEGIVNRRQDPSLLTKLNARQYKLQVFPMKGDETRKVKITFLMPADWSRETVASELPVQLLNTSKIKLPALQLLVWPDADWKNPVLVDHPELPFEAHTDPAFGNYFRTQVPTTALQPGLRFAFDSPLRRGQYLRVLQNGQSGFYQLAVLPAHLFEHEAARKIALLVDYEAGAGTITAAAILQELQKRMLLELSPLDSFNLILSSLNPQAVSNTWIPADSLSIIQAFSTAGAMLANYSNLASLLIKGIDFIKNTAGGGQILLASNASQYGNYTSANVLIQDVLALLGTPPIPLHTLNYNSANSPYFYIGGQYYYGNDYFFTNISKLSGGATQAVRNSNLSKAVASAIGNLGASLRFYDFHTTLENGYCYGRFDLGAVTEVATLNRPILQVGKFQGTFPFKIELAGELDNQFVSASLSVPAAEIQTADSLTREMWYGTYIQLLEQEPANSDLISELVFNSLTERVLSLYTAFLCLEDTTQLCPTCEDESLLVSTDDLAAQDSLLTAWPNPFSDQVTIAVQAGAGERFSTAASLEIYTATGQFVRQFPLGNFDLQQTKIVWDGRTSAGAMLPPGVYVALARINPGQKQVLKLVKRR